MSTAFAGLPESAAPSKATARPARVLVLTADTGGGHRATADALTGELTQRDEGVTVVVDPLAGPLAPRGLRWLARQYGPVIRHAPWLWSLLFHLTDRPPTSRMLTALTSLAVRQRVVDALNHHQPDVIVVLHPLLVRAAATVAHHHPARTVVVVTDLGHPHGSWWHPQVDHMVVPHAGMGRGGNGAVTGGPPAHCLGLPVRRQFTHRDGRPDRTHVRRDLGLAPDRFVVLVSGGGEGAGRVERWVHALVTGHPDVDVVVVCGRNEALRARLERLAPRPGRTLLVTGFVSDMADWMAAADLLVTKAGPGVLAEAAVLGLPVLVAGHLPGQETGNTEAVVRAGAGHAVETVPELMAAVDQLSTHPSLLPGLRHRARSAGAPRATALTSDLITTIARETP